MMWQLTCQECHVDWHVTLTVAVGYPLTVIGAAFGRSFGGTFDAPSRPKPIAREIPSVAWYRTPVVHCIIGGFLPFRSSLETLCLLVNICSVQLAGILHKWLLVAYCILCHNFLDEAVRHAIEQWITVIQAIWYERLDECSGCFMHVLLSWCRW